MREKICVEEEGISSLSISGLNILIQVTCILHSKEGKTYELDFAFSLREWAFSHVEKQLPPLRWLI